MIFILEVVASDLNPLRGIAASTGSTPLAVLDIKFEFVDFSHVFLAVFLTVARVVIMGDVLADLLADLPPVP